MLALDPSKCISASEALCSDWMVLDNGDLQIDLSSNLSKLQALVGGTNIENIAHTLQESSLVCIPFDFVTRNLSIIGPRGLSFEKFEVSRAARNSKDSVRCRRRPSRGIRETSIALMAPWPLINRCESSKLQAAVTATTMLPATHVKGEGNLMQK
jgi:hypothetical protein